MNPTLYRRINEVVGVALDLPAQERRAFLDEQCGNDPAFRAEAEALLAHAAQVPSSFLASPVLGQPEEYGTVDGPGQASTVDYPLTAGAPPAPQDIPGYRIVKTLGKGGMGVVYQAQDLKLPRLVALKMIKSGADADEKEKRRFQAEAAAVARLVHPHIVQIHEIGVHAGEPYFVLEFVEGGTLAQKMKSNLLSPRQAAEIIMPLAKAVQAAHQRGIIHRDLKPANVLLTVEGSPKITDFGLAKHLDADQALSHTGDIMGTPCYMAPEQAFGRIQDIGPASDVYALGAILYEMLTGRPPLKGANSQETFELVRHHDPVPPRKLQPKIARDLETICLKCLQKEACRRYTSSLELAQDLERFLAGEAILARTEGVLAKLARRVRRNRAASLLVVALFVALAATGVVLHRAGHAERVQDLENRLEADRDEANWSDENVQDHEGLIEQLAALDLERGAQARARFHAILLESGTKSLRQETSLQPEDKAHVERMLALLLRRDPEKAKSLHATYQTRLRFWEEIFKVVAPQKTDRDLQLFALNSKPRETLLTKHPCQGSVRLDATWESWEESSHVGLALHGDRALKMPGYVFLLETLKAPAGSVKGARQPTFADVRRQNGSVQVQILRNGVAPRTRHIPIAKLPVGPLVMNAQRQEDRLQIDINQATSLEARDLIPLIPRGSYGIVWPDQAVLKTLAGSRLKESRDPGALERGDELFALGQIDKALAFYRKQKTQLLGSRAGFEARFKESLALEHSNRGAEAIQGYQSLVEDTNEQAKKWAILASYQIWVHHLRRGSMEQADSILEKLLLEDALGKKEENLILYIPDDVRGEILKEYRNKAGGLAYWRHDTKRLHHIKRLVQVEELLDVREIYGGWSQLGLLRVLRLEGHPDQAIDVVEEWLRKTPPEDLTFGGLFAAEYGWMMREKGIPSRAVLEVDRRLLEKPGVIRAGAGGLLVERARLHAALNEWAEAARKLEEFFVDSEGPKNYRDWSAACLMLGLLREQTGDLTGALEAWRKGKYAGDPSDPDLRWSLAGGIGFANALMLESFCRELDEKRTEALFRNFLRDQTGLASMINFLDTKSLFRSTTAIMNRMWHPPKGKDIARRLVLQTCSFEEYLRLPIQVFAGEMVREEALGEPLTADQEAILWKFSKDLLAAFATGKVDELKVMKLALLWKRGPTLLGGMEIVKGLEPSLRAPAAYFLGLRLQRLGRPTVEAFQIALDNNDRNATLQRLTRTEIEKATKKELPKNH